MASENIPNLVNTGISIKVSPNDDPSQILDKIRFIVTRHSSSMTKINQLIKLIEKLPSETLPKVNRIPIALGVVYGKNELEIRALRKINNELKGRKVEVPISNQELLNVIMRIVASYLADIHSDWKSK